MDSMNERLDLLQERITDCLDEIAEIKSVGVLRSRRQPPAKKRYDGKHYATATARISRTAKARLQAIADDRGTTVSSLLRACIRDLTAGR